MLVVDEFGGKGNVLNFNVGEGVKFALPNVFWTRLTSKYGTVSVTNYDFSCPIFLFASGRCCSGYIRVTIKKHGSLFIHKGT